MQNFNICDINSDDKLSLDEFKGFLYPHYYDHTHVIHVANNIRWVKHFETSDKRSLTKSALTTSMAMLTTVGGDKIGFK